MIEYRMKDCIERNIKDVYPKKIALNEKIMIEYCYRMAGIGGSFITKVSHQGFQSLHSPDFEA